DAESAEVRRKAWGCPCWPSSLPPSFPALLASPGAPTPSLCAPPRSSATSACEKTATVVPAATLSASLVRNPGCRARVLGGGASMFGMGATELIVILVVALLVFGPRKLPEIGGALGKGIRDFRKALENKGGNDEESDVANKPTIDKPNV